MIILLHGCCCCDAGSYELMACTQNDGHAALCVVKELDAV